MANSIYKVHEMINKVGWDIEDIDTKRVISIAEKAGDLMSKGLVQEAGVAFDELGKMFNKKLQEMGKASIDFTDMIQMPDDSTLEKMTSGFTSAIASNIKNGIIAGIRGGEVEIKTLLKDLTELEAAYNRNKNKTGAKTGKRVKSGLVNRTQEAFAYEPSDTAIKIGNNLRSIANEFNRATNWEDQYVSLLKYIKAYEALEKVSTDPKALGKWSKIGDYTIEDLKAARPEIEHSLQNIFNVAYDKAVTGLTSVGDIDLGVKLTPIKMIDVYDVTEGKGYIEVEVKPVVKKARKNVVPNMYRGVHRPNADPTEGSIEGKTVNRETLGGNYWVAPESQGFVARAYGEESGLDDAKTIKAHANALNKIRVEAIKDGMSLLFNEIDKIDLLQYLFPGVENFKNVADPEGYDLTQKFYNEMARQSGFDLLEIFQVNEGGDEIANTMVTLQNRIIEYIGNIPKYLDVEKFTPEMEQHIISQQKGSSERWYDQTIARLEQELENAIRNDDAGAQKKLQTIIPQVKQMREEAMNAFDDAIVSYGGYVAEEVQRGLPQVITKDEDGNLIARITEESLKARLVKYKDLMAVPEDDDGYDQAQSEMEEIYNQIISSLPKRLQSDADNLLNDFAYGDKSTDDAMQYFAPHLAYKEPVLSDTTRDTSRVAEATKEILTQVKALEKLSERINSSGKVPSQFFDDIIADSQLLDEELKDVLSALNMMDDQGNLNLKSIHNGFSNLGGAVSDAYTVISRAGDYMPKAQDLMPKLVDAEAMGANVGTIVDVFEDKISGRIYELQKTMPGTIIPDNTDFLEATDEQIIKLIRDLEILHKTGLYIDFGNDNILYDKEKGFSFIDLATRFQEGQETTGSTAQELLNSLNPVFADNTLFGDFENKLTNIANSLGVIIPQAAEKARQSMDNFGNLGASTGTDDTSSAELEALRQQLKAKDAEISEANRKREEAELAERVAQDEVAAERHATDAAEDRAAMYDSAMKSMQEEMDGLREQLTNRASGVGDASLEELRAAQDEAEKLRQEKLRLLESNEDLRSDLESTRSYYGSALWEEEHRANQAEAEVERLKQQLTEKSGTNGLPGSGDHIDMTDEQAQLMILKDAVEAVTAAVNAKTESFKNESTVVDSSVNTEIAKLVELENKLTAIKSTLEGLLNNIKSGADDIGAGLSNIAVNVNHQSDENLKIDIPALTDAISNIQVTPDNEGLIAEIKIVAAGLGTLVAQDETLQAIKNAIETNGHSVDIDKVLDVLQNIPKNTGSNRNADINPHYLTDPHGKVVTAYRGIRDNYGGLVSNRYHGGTFSTDDIELAKVYAGELGKIEKVFLSMKNPLEIDGQGAQWDRIEYLGHGADEASRKLIELTKNIKILEDYYLSHPTGDVVHPLTGELMHDIESIREEILELRNLKEQISQDPTNPYGVGTTNHFAELAKANGYDGVIFKNVYDGLQKASNIMVTFEQDQIHYIETIGATATEAFKQLHSQAGDFNQYINISDDDIAGFVERLRQIHGEMNTLMSELYGNPDALEAAFQELKGKYIDTDPALKALYDAKLAPRDLPDDYLQLPGFVGSPFFDAEDLKIIFKQAIEFARNELNRIQTEFGTTAISIDEYQSEIDGQVDVQQEPWALESTLQAVKGVLDNIQTNTANIGVVEASTADPIAGTALDGRLTAIKSILESINNKIVEGGVIFTNGDGRRGTKDAGSKGKPARTTQFNSLIKDYENIGRLSAQFANDGNLETKAKIDLLKKEIEMKRASLKLSIDENLVLRQKYRAAFEAQKKLLDAAKAQKAIDDQRKAADDDAKKHEKDADIERKEQAKAQASRQAQVKSLAKDYEKLGKLAAQFDDDGNLETKAKLELLKEEIKTKRASLKLSIDENLILRQQYSAAFDAQKRLLEAAKADDQWKKQVKDAQRATGINAATSAANAGDQTVLRTIGAKDVSDDISQKAKELSDQIKALRALRDEIDKKGDKASDEDRNNLSKQIASVKTLKSELDGYLKIHEKYSGDDVTDLGDASNFGAVGTNEYWNNITAAVKAQAEGRVAIKGLNADTGELTGTTRIAANTFATWSAAVDPLTGRLNMLRTGIKKTETLVESITRKTKEIFTYFSGSSIIFKFFNEVRRGIQYIREIDLALTELKKVTDETEETYDRFLETAAKTGARLGATISAVTEATATFAKLGYDMVTATEMAEAAIVYKNVGDNIASTEDAADSIISTLKGFGMEASEAMAIVDRFNEVGNRFAITSQGIGEALRLSASALNEGGNSLDESIAMITAANEVVNDPSAVGTALKTLTLRLRGSKTELEEMGEDVSDMATTTSQLQAKLLALTGGQVDIMLDETTFKNSTQILREMAEAWEDMDDISRASALELMGGRLLPLRIEICA